MTKIAYIDDCQTNLECLALIFANEFSMDTFLGPTDFLAGYSTSYAAILIDFHMPGMSGHDLYEQLIHHPNYNGCPIIFISGDDSDNVKIRSLELGAVDFMSRAISPNEMLARVRSKIKFYQKHRHIIEFDELKINLAMMKTYVSGEEVPLTFIELKLLSLVLRGHPDLVPKDMVVDQVWKNGHAGDSTVYAHLSNLNSKLTSWDHELSSIKGKGIQLVRKVRTE